MPELRPFVARLGPRNRPLPFTALPYRRACTKQVALLPTATTEVSIDAARILGSRPAFDLDVGARLVPVPHLSLL